MPQTDRTPPVPGNVTPLLWDNSAPRARLLLNNRKALPKLGGMTTKQTAAIALFALALPLGLFSGAAAAAACSAEYKAQRDNPTAFRHAVMQVPDARCSPEGAAAYVRARLAETGWTLLLIVKLSD